MSERKGVSADKTPKCIGSSNARTTTSPSPTTSPTTKCLGASADKTPECLGAPADDARNAFPISDGDIKMQESGASPNVKPMAESPGISKTREILQRAMGVPTGRAQSLPPYPYTIQLPTTVPISQNTPRFLANLPSHADVCDYKLFLYIISFPKLHSEFSII